MKSVTDNNSSIRLLLVACVLICIWPVLTQAEIKPPLVIVSIKPEAYLVKRIAGEIVNVEVILPSNANHELFEPSITQFSLLTKAKIFFRLGQKHFPFESVLIQQLKTNLDSLKVVDLSQGIIVGSDPHIWLNPNFVRSMVSKIAQTLSELLPEHTEEFMVNKERFLSELDQLVKELDKLFVTQRGRKFIVFHDSWGYFADQFGLKQVAIETEGKEADLQQISRVIELGKKEGIKTIFVEPGFSSSSAELIASEIGAKIETIDPFAFDWLSNMRYVSQVINKALTNDQPGH